MNIEQSVPADTKPSRKSYAEAARSAETGRKPIPATRAREPTVYLQAEQLAELQNLLNLPVFQNVNQFWGVGDGAAAAAAAARRLPSGDWVIVFRTEEDREAAQEKKDWPAEAFGAPAVAKGKSYTVVVKGLRVFNVK